MNIVFSYFPYFIAFFILLSLASIYEHYRFLRVEGDLKRGLMIGTAPLTWEMRQFLETMPSSWQDSAGFIRKEINEVLIAGQKTTLIRFTRRRNSLLHVAYINLSDPQNQIEFRVPFSPLISMVVGLTFFLLIFFDLFLSTANGAQPPLFVWFFPVIFLSLMVGSLIFNHQRERKRLLDILKRAIEQRI